MSINVSTSLNHNVLTSILDFIMVDIKKTTRTRRIVEEFVSCLFRGEKTMPILFYYPLSAPCRAVLLLGRLMNIEFDLKIVDITKGENLLPQFIKVN